MCMRRSLGAEAAPNMRSDDMDARRFEPKHRCQGIANIVHALRRVVKCEITAGPHSDGGVWLHRIVVFHRRGVGLVDYDRSRRQCCVDITFIGVGRKARVHFLRRVQILAVRSQLDIMRLLIVAEADPICRVPCNLG